MRTFPILYVVLFIIVYVLISAGATKSLLKIALPGNRKKVMLCMLVISALISLSFIFLYIWPLSPRSIKDYSVHLIYNAIFSVDFVFKVPLAFSIFTGTFFSSNRKPAIYFMGLILSIGLSSSIIYGSLFGTKELSVNKIELRFPDIPKNYDGFKILQLSDTHLGNFLKSKQLLLKVQNETEVINPDIVIFTGDLVNNFSNELGGFGDVFRKITNKKECYSILGNHDYGNYSSWKSDAGKIENFNQIVAAHQNFGFKLLNNENIIHRLGNDSINIIGVENWGHAPFPQYANLEKAMNGIPEKSFKILLSHDPAHWEEVIKNRGDIALTLSGHTHGLQWGIKKAGITFSLGYLARKEWGGLYKFDKSQLYVNTGLGTVGIPWRINMPAELTVITLKRVEID